jgi:hypothetical protein
MSRKNAKELAGWFEGQSTRNHPGRNHFPEWREKLQWKIMQTGT